MPKFPARSQCRLAFKHPLMYSRLSKHEVELSPPNLPKALAFPFPSK